MPGCQEGLCASISGGGQCKLQEGKDHVVTACNRPYHTAFTGSLETSMGAADHLQSSQFNSVSMCEAPSGESIAHPHLHPHPFFWFS